MKLIKLQKAIDLIQGSAAVIVTSEKNSPVLYAHIDKDIILDLGSSMIVIPKNKNEFVKIKENSLVFIGDSSEEFGDLVAYNLHGRIDEYLVELELLFKSQLNSFCQESDYVLN